MSPKRATKSSEPVPPIVNGLHGGHYLWPLMEAAERIGFISWRSEVPEIAGLLKLPKEEHPAMLMGFFQLFIVPGTVDASEAAIGAAKQVLIGLVRVRKERPYLRVVLSQSDVDTLAEWLSDDPPITQAVWHLLVKILDASRKQGVSIPESLGPYSDLAAVKSRRSLEAVLEQYRGEKDSVPA